MIVEKSTEQMSMLEKGIEAAACYLAKRGYEVIEKNLDARGAEFPIVAISDGGAICLVDVSIGGEPERPFPDIDDLECRRGAFEAAMVDLLRKAGEKLVNRSVRYDRVHIHPVDADRAILRHHINALA